MDLIEGLRNRIDFSVGVPTTVTMENGVRVVREAPDKRPQKFSKAKSEAIAALGQLWISAATKEEIDRALLSHRANLYAVGYPAITDYLRANPIKDIPETNFQRGPADIWSPPRRDSAA